MSAFKPFAPHAAPPNHPIPRRPTDQGTHQGPAGAQAQGPGVPSSYCGAGGAVSGGRQSPDIGYVSLEHPSSRSASYVSQISMQLGSQLWPQSDEEGSYRRSSRTPPSSFDRIPSRDALLDPGRSGIHDVSTDSSHSGTTSNNYDSSLGSVYSCSNSLISTRSDSNFEGQGQGQCQGQGQGRRRSPGGGDDGSRQRQGVYAKVANTFKGKESVVETVKPGRRLRMVVPSSTSSKDLNLSISDLRNILVIKETELRMLRDTMSKNESAMLQVFEDKKRRWQTEMADRKTEWQHHLEAANNRWRKTEQLLKFQAAKLHQENRRLQGQVEELAGEKRHLFDRCQSLELQLDGLKTDMRGLLNDVSAKNCDVIQLKTDMRGPLNDVSAKNCDVIRSSAIDADRYKIDANCSSREVEDSSKVTAGVSAARVNWHGGGPRDPGALVGPSELRRELDWALRAIEAGRAEFERERQGWALEKEKVVDYQKRLQLAYLQVLHKNRVLELDVQQLTGEMAAFDVKRLSTGNDETKQATKPEKTGEKTLR